VSFGEAKVHKEESFNACADLLFRYFAGGGASGFSVSGDSSNFSLYICFQGEGSCDKKAELFRLNMVDFNVWTINKVAYKPDTGYSPPPGQKNYRSVTLTHGFFGCKNKFDIHSAIKRIDKELETDKDLVDIAKEKLNPTTFIRPVPTPPPPQRISHRFC